MTNKETTVIIPHASSTETLIALLIELQHQTKPPKDIIIIDCSSDKTGLRIARKFSFNLTPITVIVRKGTIYENWNEGLEVGREKHPNANFLIVNDDILIPTDAIETFEKFVKDNTLCLVPETPTRYHYENYVNTVFQTKSKPTKTTITEWMSGFVFYLTKKCVDEIGYFNTNYKVWFGDTDFEDRIKKVGKIEKIEGLYVYHYGSKSYKYQSKEVQEQISKDRELYFKLKDDVNA